MVGMHFVVVWRRICTSLEFPTKSSREFCGTLNVAVTQNCYIKTADSEVTAAMLQFERVLESPNMHLSGAQRQRLM